MSDSAPPVRDLVWRVALGATALLVLGAFLFSLREVLSPFLLYVVFVVLSLPFRGQSGYRLVVGMVTLLLVLWILKTTGSLLAPFALALAFAYILDPLVDRMSEGRLSRTLSIALLTGSAFVLLGVAMVVGLPAVSDQAGQLIQQFPDLIERSPEWLERFENFLLRIDLPVVDEAGLVESIRAVDGQTVVDFLEQRRASLGQRLWNGVLGLGRGLGSVVTVFGYVVLTPVLTFYLLRDYDSLTSRCAELLPEHRREWIVGLAREYDGLVSKYMRGQVTVALIVGLLTGIGLWITGFPGALVIGALVGVLSVVPYLGLLLSLIPAVLIALLSANIVPSLAKVGAVFLVVQLLEGTLISPKIVGDSVGLHPVWIVLALSVGGFYFGFLGLLIAVPAAAGVKLLLEHGRAAYLESGFYLGKGEA